MEKPWYVLDMVNFKESDMKVVVDMQWIIQVCNVFTKWLRRHVLWRIGDCWEFLDIPACGKIYIQSFRVHYIPQCVLYIRFRGT